jgi:hypothetical protein
MHKYDLAERKPSCMTPVRPIFAEQRSEGERAIEKVS